MKPASNTKIFETTISTFWFDESEILCGVSKIGERTVERNKEVFKLYKELTKNGNKLCLLADTTDSPPMTKEVINYIAAEYPKYFKAMALISPTALAVGQVNAFMKLTFSNFPIMIFSNEKEARAWLKDYL